MSSLQLNNLKTGLNAVNVNMGIRTKGAGVHKVLRRYGWAGPLLLGLFLASFKAVSASEVLRDIPYGPSSYQRMDIYLPNESPVGGAPVIFFVHGGAWQYGDKSNPASVNNKARHWTAEGYIFISANNRLSPDADPSEQADDIAEAVAFAQKEAPQWGGNPKLFILMGHSAGAHLVSLVSADPEVLAKHGAQRLIGTVALDSAAYDVTQIMRFRHHRFYDFVFGEQTGFWQDVSPVENVKPGAPPMMLVCSEFRVDSCGQAKGFARRLQSVGTHAEILPMRLSHGAINNRLGIRGDYTDAVDAFLSSLEVP